MIKMASVPLPTYPTSSLLRNDVVNIKKRQGTHTTQAGDGVGGHML